MQEKEKSKIKRNVIVVAIIAIVLILIGIICKYIYHYSNSVSIHNDEKIMKEADNYISEFYDDISIVDHSQVVKKEENGVVAVLVRYTTKETYHVDCIYFVQDKYLKERYYVLGALETADGEIVADSQNVNNQIVTFVRGMNIPKEIASFEIPSLGYEAEVIDGTYLDIILPFATKYEVITNK